MTYEVMQNLIRDIAVKHYITKVVLFGSRASGTNKEDSDIDLIIEFSKPVSLMDISELRYELEDVLGLPVDIVHGPIRQTDLLEIGKTVELYAA